MIKYQPKPGSFPARLIEHLTAVGGTMTKIEMAQGFAEPRKNIDGLTKTVIAHGLIVDCGERADGKRAYGLPGADSFMVAPLPHGALTLGMQTQPVQAVGKKATKKRAALPAPVVESLPSPTTSSTPIAALWEDGDVCLYGLQINADESATMGEGHARRLHKFLERVFGPTV